MSMTITVKKTDGDVTIAVVGDMAADDALRAHGFDPDTADFSVQE